MIPHDPPSESAVRGLTIVIPAKDEAGRIVPTLDGLSAFRSSRFEIREVIVIDDGSTDGTQRVVREHMPEANVLRHESCRGKGAAVRTGVAAATQPWLLIVDADLSVSLEHLEDFARAADRTPLVIGSKYLAESHFEAPTLRRLPGRLGSWLVSLCATPGIADTQCGFKLIRSDAARGIFQHQRLNGFGYDFEVLFLARRLGFDIAERPVSGRHDAAGRVSLSSYFGVLGELFAFLGHRMLGRYPRPGGGEASGSEIQ